MEPQTAAPWSVVRGHRGSVKRGHPCDVILVLKDGAVFSCFIEVQRVRSVTSCKVTQLHGHHRDPAWHHP